LKSKEKTDCKKWLGIRVYYDAAGAKLRRHHDTFHTISSFLHTT